MHAGAGASMCCVQRGKSVDTTMGMTPLEGCVPRIWDYSSISWQLLPAFTSDEHAAVLQ